MAKFRVPFKAHVTVYVTVEADDQEDAIEKAEEQAYIQSFIGNGGDKMIGVTAINMSVAASNELEVIEDDVEEI